MSAHRKLELKCWQRSSDWHQWDLTRWAMMVYARRPLKMGKLMKRELHHARLACAQLLGQDMITEPKLQLLKRGVAPTPDVRDQWAATTPTFLFLMAFQLYNDHVRGEHRLQCIRVLHGFLQRFLAPAAKRAVSKTDPPPQSAGLCAEQGGAAQCEHVMRTKGKLDAAGPESVARIIQMMEVLIQESDSCEAVMCWLGLWVLTLAEHIEESVNAGKWETDACKAENFRTGKQDNICYIDPDFKLRILDRVRNKQISPSGALRLLEDDRAPGAEKWALQQLRQEVSKGWLTWSTGGVCFFNPEAARISTEDTLFMQFWHADSDTGGWLPPQAKPPAADRLATRFSVNFRHCDVPSGVSPTSDDFITSPVADQCK